MTNKLIIVEGQDNCGKSTLIKNIKRQINNHKILTISSSGPPKHVMNNDWNIQHYTEMFSLMSYLLDNGYDIITDRFHIGETTYGKLFRNMNTDYIWDIENNFISQYQSQTSMIMLTDYGDAIINRDDGLSIETCSNEFEQIRKLFGLGFEISGIHHKKLINISDNGWPDSDILYDWIYKCTQ